MVWIGLLIVVVAVFAILKKVDTRIVLIVAGTLMCLLGGVEALLKIFPAFSGQLISSSLVPAITTCMGFSAVMEYTKCTDHLVHVLLKPLKKVRPLLVPGAFLITWIISMSLQSASACGAAVGALLIPTMLNFGVNPIIAATAVILGTWGNVMSPGHMWTVSLSEITGTAPDVVFSTYAVQCVIAAVASAIVLTVIDIVIFKKKEAKKAEEVQVETDDFKINPIKAILPMLPVVLIILNGKMGWGLDVMSWMLICTALAVVINIKDFKGTSNAFFKGMGSSFGDIITLMAAAAVFTAGMSAVGLTNALLEIMKNSSSVASLGATFGPFALAMATGSGNAAIAAFNEALVPFAADFGFTQEALGAVALIAGGIGRSCSPVAGVTIIVARIAKVEPMDAAKYGILPCLVSAIILMFTLL